MGNHPAYKRGLRSPRHGALKEDRARLQQQKEPEMFTRSVSASPVRMASYRAKLQRAPTGIERWTRCRTEVRSHIAVLEQATMAIFEGYLGRPLYHRAAHAAEWLLALAERL